MRRSVFKLLSLVSMFSIILMATLFITFSWFIQTYSVDGDILGKTRSLYFAGGIGTANEPYVLSEPIHFYNLAYLQNLGVFNSSIHFKVGNIARDENGYIIYENGVMKINPIDNILFNNYPIPPIGTSQKSFLGTFDGNGTIFRNYIVDGTGKQDIGFFGNIGSGSSVSNFYLDNITIKSNPKATDYNLGNLHNHNNINKNVATGYIVGHIAKTASLQRAYVITPKIDSMLNEFANRSQYGLIGYDDQDNGEIPGGARSYRFVLNAAGLNPILDYARINLGTRIVSGTNRALNTVITKPAGSKMGIDGASQSNNSATTFSLSTIKIPDDNGVQDHLIDILAAKGQTIGDGSGVYNRSNIDIVGEIQVDNGGIIINKQFNPFIIPVSSTESNPVKFNPTNYPQSVILYIKPTGFNELGSISITTAQSASILFNRGFNNTGSYLGINSSIQASTVNLDSVPSLLGIAAGKIDRRLALTAISFDANGDMIVNVTNPEYYVFVLSASSGNVSFTNFTFEYIPPEVPLSKLSRLNTVDFIRTEDISTLRTSPQSYVHSYLNLSYDIANNHKFNLGVIKRTNVLINGIDTKEFQINFTRSIPDTSHFYIDIVNTKKNQIVITYNNGSTIYTGQAQIINIWVDKNYIYINGNRHTVP